MARTASEAVPRWRHWLSIGLMVAAAALLAASFFFPWWHFTLYAPQYPHGLSMDISLKGVTGDVREIDGLNHYIGMTRLEKVASTELRLAPYGVAAVSVLVLGSILVLRRKVARLVIVPAVALPLGFVADAFYWLYRAGHELNPHAPIHLPPFTPQMFGNGKIGQFLTFAAPSMGFALACIGAALVIVAAWTMHRSGPAKGDARGAKEPPHRGGLFLFRGDAKGVGA